MFLADWPTNKIVFCNPPYSQTAPAIRKGLIEYNHGVSSVILIPHTSVLGGLNLKCMLPKLTGKIHRLDPIAFEG